MYGAGFCKRDKFKVGHRGFKVLKKWRQGPGDDLLSHGVVSSARQGLTSVFGMRTGVAPALESPGLYLHLNIEIYYHSNIRNIKENHTILVLILAL